MRFRVAVAIGNRKGLVGFGVGKAGEVITAIQKAVHSAKKNLQKIDVIEDTILHSIKHKYKSARIMLMPAGEGTGIIAGGAIRKIIELSGIKNILSKSHGTANKISAARATLQALEMLSKSGKKHGVNVKKPVEVEAPVVAAEPAKATKSAAAPKKEEAEAASE